LTTEKRRFPVQAIGTIRRDDGADPDKFLDPAASSIIHIESRWESGLTGIEEFSHLVVLFYLDRAEPRGESGEPMRPEGRQELPEVGFFATRTPRRPNPIGICCPRLIRREGRDLHVTGLDAWDSTPVLDIKGYFLRDEQRPDATVPQWLTSLWAAHDEERKTPSEPSQMPAPGTVVARHETPMGEVVFRYPLPTDAPAALAYINALSAEQTFVLFQGDQLTLEQEQAWVDVRIELLEAGRSVTILAFAGDRYIGCGQIDLGSMVSRHVGYFGISLAPDYRDARLGTKLMQAVIVEAERRLDGLRLIQLDVFASNDRAVHLYRKLGFIEYARLPAAIHRLGEYEDLISMYQPVVKSNR